LEWLLELLVYRVLGGVIQSIFYWPGWLLLKVISLGNYPPEQTVEHNRFAVAVFAIVALVLLVAALSLGPRLV
jgi:hypothetical protein